jgi:hypothetical protein
LVDVRAMEEARSPALQITHQTEVEILAQHPDDDEPDAAP